MLTNPHPPLRLYLPVFLLMMCFFPLSSVGQQTLTLTIAGCDDNGQFSSLGCTWTNSKCSLTQNTDYTDLGQDGTTASCLGSAPGVIASTLEINSGDGTTTQDITCHGSITVDDSCGNPMGPFFDDQYTYHRVCDTSDPTSECFGSPIIIDVADEGFHLTSALNGVKFDIRGNGHPLQIAWTDPQHRNAFLALDRNHNGLIDNGTELFGNFTLQPKSPSPNGFLALAEFDKPQNGGNGDGIIDEHDAVYSHLVLWIDENHDGISQPNELHRLEDLGVLSVSLKYHLSRKDDPFGNEFRFRAKINPKDPSDVSEVGRTAYDVFLGIQ